LVIKKKGVGRLIYEVTERGEGKESPKRLLLCSVLYMWGGEGQRSQK